MSYALVLAARSVRMFAYGAISVVLAIYLAKAGMRAATIGAIVTLAYLAGAAFSLASGWLSNRFGVKTVMVAASSVMACSGALLAAPQYHTHAAATLAFVLAAALLGTISPGGQEVGPFTAIEQAAIAGIGERHSARRFAVYGLLGSLSLALGALATSVVPAGAIIWCYAGAGTILAVLYSFVRRDAGTGASADPAPAAPRAVRRWGPAQSLAALFSLDAFAGGFVIQSIMAYWFYAKFGASTQVLGVVFFAANTLSALSLLAAARLSERIGLLNTMVFTHLPSNVLLILVPLMPSFPLALTVLLARFAISQMDVPTRQAFTMAVVEPGDRARAAGLTNAVRPIAAAASPMLSGIALQSVAWGFPFYAAGILKIAYDLTLFVLFRRAQKRV